MKGQVSEKIVNLTLLLVAFVILFSVIGIRYASLLKDRGSSEVCRTSFIAASKSNIIGKKVLSIKCSQDKIKFTKKDKEYSMRSDILNELKRCNYMTAEGKVDPFSQNILSTGVACLICSRIEVKDGAPEFKDILNSLKETSLNEDQSYFDYIYGDRTIFGFHYGTKDLLDDKPVITDVLPNQNYYIIYQQTSKGFLTDVDDDEFYSSILLIPVESLGDYRCDYLAN